MPSSRANPTLRAVLWHMLHLIEPLPVHRLTPEYMDGTERSGLDRNELRAQVAEIDWYHSIDLGDGVVTPGAVKPDELPDELFPDLAGRSVLDIGTWDGANAFRAERLGAARVVALDHYAWGVDIARREKYWEECVARGELPDHGRDETDFWNPRLPRKRGFDLAHSALASAVEPVVDNFMTVDLSALGAFDVVLYLGVLYHVQEPLTALRRVRHVTAQVAMIETEALSVRGHGQERLIGFLPGDELRGDFGNWFIPSEAALHALCRAAGFRKVETVRGAPVTRARVTHTSFNYRIVVHAYV